MAQSAGVVFVTVLPNMEAFAAQLEAGVTGAAGAASAAAAAKTESGITSGVGNATSGLKSKFGTMGLLIGGAFAVGFAKKSIDAAEAVEKQIARVAMGMEHIGEGTLTNVMVEKLRAAGDATVTTQAATDKLGASLLNLGHAYFETLGAAAPGVLAGLTQGILNISAATGKPLGMLQRSLTMSILNTPEKAIPMLKKLGIASADQAAHFTALAKAGDAVKLRQEEINAVTNAYPGAAGRSATAGERFKKSMNDLEVDIGTKLLPVLNFMAHAFESVPGPVKEIVIVGGTLMITLALMQKLLTTLGNTVIGNFIKQLYAKVAAQLVDTGSTVGLAGATDTLILSETGATAGAADLTVQEQLLQIQQTNLTASTGILGSSMGGLGAATAVAGAAIAGFAIGSMVNKMFHISDTIDRHLVPSLDTVSQRLNAMGPPLTDLEKNMDPTTVSINRQADQIALLEKNLGSGTLTTAQFTDGINVLNKVYGTSIDGTNLATAALKRWSEEGIVRAQTAADAHLASMKLVNHEMERYTQVTGFAIDATKSSDENIAAAKTAWLSWRDATASSINFVVGDLSTLMQNSNITAAQISKNLDKQAKDMKTFGGNLNKIAADGTKGSQALVQQLIAAGPAGEHMASVIANATPKLRRHIEQDIGGSLQASQGEAGKLETALTGGFDKIAASILVATGAVNDFAAGMAQVTGANINVNVDSKNYRGGSGHHAGPPNYKKYSHDGYTRAGGGPVDAGQGYLIGEHGQEWFRPDVSGTVVSHEELAAAAGPARPSGPQRITITDSNLGIVMQGVVQEHQEFAERAARTNR